MSKRMIVPPGFEQTAARLNMSAAIEAGGIVYCTGVTGSGPDGAMPKDPRAQFEAVFEKISATLATVAADVDAVVEMTSYHVGLREHFDVFDAVRCRVFTAPYPAWTAVEVAGLRRPEAVVEVRVIAHLPK